VTVTTGQERESAAVPGSTRASERALTFCLWTTECQSVLMTGFSLHGRLAYHRSFDLNGVFPLLDFHPSALKMASLFNLSVSSLSLTFVGTFAGYVYWRYTMRKRSSLPYPPGPSGFPLIGNLLDMPTEYEWLAFKKYAEQYGKTLFSIIDID
jgi:hypothetical protein